MLNIETVQSEHKPSSSDKNKNNYEMWQGQKGSKKIKIKCMLGI